MSRVNHRNGESGLFPSKDQSDGKELEVVDIMMEKNSKYRPFKNKEECWQEMQKHQPFAWVKEKHSDRYSLITEVNGLSIKVKEGCLFTDSVKYYTFADGTPFGVKMEE